MEYNRLRNKVNKFYTGGKIPKLQTAWQQMPGTFDGQSDGNGKIWNSALNMWVLDPNLKLQLNHTSILDLQTIDQAQNFGVQFQSGDPNGILGQTTTSIGNDGIAVSQNSNGLITINGQDQSQRKLGNQSITDLTKLVGQDISGVNFSKDASWKNTGLSEKDATGIGIATKAFTAAVNVADQLTMGDKNFGALSEAIDSTVHGVSGTLLSSGNPFAMAAGAALEGANFLTKAGGKTVEGFDVNIESSGYGNLGHMESSSSRDFGAMIGLGGIFNKGAIERKLAKRNEQARMAMKAAEISEDIKFEQEARMNDVDNILRNNQIALAGGIDINSLGS